MRTEGTISVASNKMSFIKYVFMNCTLQTLNALTQKSMKDFLNIEDLVFEKSKIIYSIVLILFSVLGT